MPLYFTSIRVNGDPLGGGPLTAGMLESVLILDDDAFLEPETTDTGPQYNIGGVDFTSSAWPGFSGTGVEIYSATVNGQTVTFGYLSSATDTVDDAIDRLVLLTGTINPGDTITGITLINGGNTNIPYTDIPSLICFTAGTRITTPIGPVLIEHLKVGDLIITADHGLQAIRWIGKKHMTGARFLAYPHLRPIRIKANGFKVNGPHTDLLVSPQHRIFLQSAEAQLMFGKKDILVPAKGLVNDTTVLTDYRCPHIDYIHLLFDRHEIVQANGLWTESFHPGHMGLNAIETEARAELLEIFPELERNPAAYGPTARPILSVSETKHLSSPGYLTG